MSTEQPTEAWEEAGFEYDAGDPTVGIQPGWAHWCGQAQVEESDPSVDINEGWAFLHYVGSGINRKAVGDKSLVCNECGANFTWIEADWSPEIEEPGGSDDYTTDPF